MSRFYSLSAVVGCAFVVASLVGCKSDAQPQNKPFTAKGTATKIDLAAKKVSMRTKLEKSGKELEIEGTTTAETEVWVSGRKGTLADVEVGDTVEVEAYQTGEKSEKKFMVSRVDVKRPEGWKSTKASSTAPMASTPPASEKPPVTMMEKPQLPASSKPPQPAATTQDTAATESLKAQKTAEIYTLIRQRMNEAIEARAKLMKEGRLATDPECMKHERIIRNARSLLIEQGENLGPVQPPMTGEGPMEGP